MLHTLQYGWDYLPGYLGFTALYFALVWVGARLLRSWKLHAAVRA